MQSQNNAVVYTYKVDIVEDSLNAQESVAEGEDDASTAQSITGLETYLKHKIMN